jgi:hypothetical protein
VKALLDALRMPTRPEIKSANLAPETDQAPFLCLLEDDVLVTGLNVQTDYFLDAAAPNECFLVVDVEIRPSKVTFANLGLG